MNDDIDYICMKSKKGSIFTTGNDSNLGLWLVLAQAWSFHTFPIITLYGYLFQSPTHFKNKKFEHNLSTSATETHASAARVCNNALLLVESTHHVTWRSALLFLPARALQFMNN